jgi:branched-chain amino acid transport system ATP-binding protein
VLELQNVTKKFKGLVAVNCLSLVINDGEILGLIGPNGAGKTVTINLASGVILPDDGRVVFDGKDVTRERPDIRACMGVSRTFQQANLFPQFSVMQNVLVGLQRESRIRLIDPLAGPLLDHKQKEAELVDRAMKILDRLDLLSVQYEAVRNLPYGLQKRVGIGIALGSSPKTLLLDEPLTGLSTSEVEEALEMIQRIHNSGLALLIVEHNVAAVMRLCDRIAVLNFGEKIAEGPPHEIQNNQKVIEVYLGA